MYPWCSFSLKPIADGSTTPPLSSGTQRPFPACRGSVVDLRFVFPSI